MADQNGRWPLSGTGNTLLGGLIVALGLLFAFLNGIPWERKGAAAEVRVEFQRELASMREDIREIRAILEGRRR